MLHFRLTKSTIICLLLLISDFSFGQGTAYSVEDSYTTFKDMNNRSLRGWRDESLRDENNFLEGEGYIYYTGWKWGEICLTRISKNNPSESITSQIEFPSGHILLHTGIKDNQFYVVYYEMEGGKAGKPITLMYREYDFDKKDWLMEPIKYVEPHYELAYGTISSTGIGFNSHPFIRRTSNNEKHTIYAYSPLTWDKQDRDKISVALSDENKIEWHETYTLPWSRPEGELFQTLIANDGIVYMIYGIKENEKGPRDGHQLKILSLEGNGNFSIANLDIPFTFFSPSIKLVEHPVHGKIIMVQGGSDKKIPNKLFYAELLNNGKVKSTGQVDLGEITSASDAASKNAPGWSIFEKKFTRYMKMYDFEVLDDDKILIEFHSFYSTPNTGNLTLNGIGLLKFEIPSGNISWAQCIPINHITTNGTVLKYRHLKIANTSHIIFSDSDRQNDNQSLLMPKRILRPTSTVLKCYSIPHESGKISSRLLCNREGAKVPGLFISNHCIYYQNQLLIDVSTLSGKRSILTIPIKL